MKAVASKVNKFRGKEEDPKKKLEHDLQKLDKKFYYPKGKGLFATPLDSMYAPMDDEVKIAKGNCIKAYIEACRISGKIPDLSNIAVGEVTIQDFNFGNTNMTGTSFKTPCGMGGKSILDGCNFSRSTLDNTNFDSASLRKANFHGCDLRACIFYDNDLTDAILTDIKIGSSFANVDLNNALTTAGTFDEKPLKTAKNLNTLRILPFGYGNTVDALMMLKTALHKSHDDAGKVMYSNPESNFNLFPVEIGNLIAEKIIQTPPSDKYVQKLLEERQQQANAERSK